MKKRSFALAAALVLALVLTGCSADREGNTMTPSHNVYESDNGNDAFQGGGAGGTNDRDNDGLPDGSIGSDVDDIGRDAGDLARDAGDAIGDAVGDVGRAMH